jgi:hypothetical protein
MGTNLRKRPIICADLNNEVFDVKQEANVARILTHVLGVKYIPHKEIIIKNIATKYRLYKERVHKEDKANTPFTAIQPDFYLPDYDVYIEVKPCGIRPGNNDWKKLASAYLKEEKLEVWGEGTYKLLTKAFKQHPLMGEYWDKGEPAPPKSSKLKKK